ncbi:hypothetical protein [Pseudoalteromonas sp. S16_S37]|uniref:hypothetical protein n=1 Tax=Pseudoalteromonas sp. S16_S37 TaxID=2720228 RepID=UPI001681A24B|nr:hypothetical protein [Pseudoalteromonas sp. S16_S37]MBD1582588.1 hypothetical protein [Pseudoalteromonas sp. S16_S37]
MIITSAECSAVLALPFLCNLVSELMQLTHVMTLYLEHRSALVELLYRHTDEAPLKNAARVYQVAKY